MKCNVVLYVGDYDFIDFNDNFDDTYTMNIFINKDKNVKEYLKDINILKLIKESLDFFMDNTDEYNDNIEIANKILSNEIEIDKDISFINIELDDGIEEFLDNNQELIDKDICLVGEYSVNHEELDNVLRKVGKYKNIKLYLDGNEEAVTIFDFEKTVDAIDEITNKIKKYNLSQLEQIMYAYDLVRDRVYTKEDDNDSLNVSRDITSVLFGDKIVCVGYANIFEKVLLNLGINCMMYSIKSIDNGPGHRRNVVYVDDKKYNVVGVFFFDPTWDSKRSIDDKTYLNSYKFFCRNKDEIDIYTRDKFIDRTFNGYKDESLWVFEDIVLEKGITSVPREMIRTFNVISEFIDNKILINPVFLHEKVYSEKYFNLDTIMGNLIRYRELIFDCKLNPDKLFKVLFNVRKIEYYENPDKFTFDIESLKDTMVDDMNDEDMFANRLFNKLLGLPNDLTKISESEFNRIVNEFEFDKIIEEIKFTKLLRSIYNKNKNLYSLKKRINTH